jgi:phage gp29-like protein
MKLLEWLGLADRDARSAPAPQRQTPDLEEHGATGTTIFGGYLRDAGEYNTALEGLSAFTTYEKMRRSDAQVSATLMGMKLPIRSAEWTVAEPDDATPVEKEAAEFVRECLFEEIDFEAAIDNALLMLDFGCSAHEDVWYVDGNRVRLKKLAPRLPVTFHRWIVDGEELRGLEQYGFTSDGYKTSQIPVDKLGLFTFQQEGANYAGRSVMRAMYQHWYIKSNLYKIDAIACERNGMGIPWGRMAENAKAEDRRTGIEWLEQLSTHQKAALLLPPNWEWGLKGVEGEIRDPKESIAHHNVMISMAGLAQFMMLGQSSSGNRALGETMSDFFHIALQSIAKRIARSLNGGTIKRLVDCNFTGIERYPRLIPQQILSLGFESIKNGLLGLANANIGIVQPDEDLEKWIRAKMGAPDPGTPRPRPQKDQPISSEGEGDQKAPGQGRAAFSESGGQRRRELRGAERYLALDEMEGVLDRGRDDVAAVLRKSRSAVQAEIVNKVISAPIRTLYRVSIPPDQKLIDQVEAILEGIHGAGIDQVEQERARQLSGKPPSDARTIRAAAILGKKKRMPLGVYADAIVSEFLNTLTQRAANVALDWIRRPNDLTKGEIIRTVEDELDEQSDKWMDGAASKGVNEAFADGRAAGYEEHAEEIGEVQYSALLDFNTCTACAAADGAVGKTPADIPAVPNPDCEGGDKCRCVHVFVFADEVRR